MHEINFVLNLYGLCFYLTEHTWASPSLLGNKLCTSVPMLLFDLLPLLADQSLRGGVHSLIMLKLYCFIVTFKMCCCHVNLLLYWISERSLRSKSTQPLLEGTQKKAGAWKTLPCFSQKHPNISRELLHPNLNGMSRQDTRH